MTYQSKITRFLSTLPDQAADFYDKNREELHAIVTGSEPLMSGSNAISSKQQEAIDNAFYDDKLRRILAMPNDIHQTVALLKHLK
jgi:hypothetical protein